MPDKDPAPADSAASVSSADALRRRAEALARERGTSSQGQLAGFSLEEVEKMLHELRVHQIELELQNEELQRTQAELTAGRARYFDLYELAPVGYITLSEAGLVRQANLGAAKLLGAARSALLQRPFSNFILPADQDIFYQARKQLLQSGEPQSCELRLVMLGATQVWLHLTAALAQDAECDPEIRLMASDITERKQAEEALRDALEFSNSMISSMQDGFLVLDRAGVTLEANPALCLMTGFSREELVGVGVPHPYWPPEEHERVQAALSETMRGGWRIFELTLMRRNGERFPATVSPFSVANKDGEVTSYAATIRDITERKRAEEVLAAERTLLSTLVDLLPTWIFVKDRDSRFLRVNRACAANMGAATPEEMIGKSDADFYPPEVAESLRLEEQEVLKGIPIVNRETRKHTASGEPRILLITKVPLRDADGTITGLAGAGVDITEIKQAEEALRESEAFQRAILNSLPAHVAVLDKDGKIIAVNEPWLQFARENGNPAEEKIGVGADYLEVCHKAIHVGDPYAEDAVAGVTAMLSGEKTRFTLEYPCDAPGRARWFTMEVVRPAGDIGGVIVAHSDITERKQAEEKILQLNAGLERRVKERTAELLATNASLVDFKHALDEHAIVAITDPGGTITYANDRFCEVSKYPREELLGQTHRIVNSGYHPPKFFQNLWDTILSGRTWKGEVRNRAKDGSIYWVSSTIVPFLGPDGKPEQFIAIRTDISKRKRMEEALHESEERVRLAAEAADIAVWEWDLRTNELKWDARMFEIYGLPPNPDGRATYQDWTSALLPEELAEEEAQLQHTIATCGRGQREFRIKRASDHAVRIIQASEVVITGADGKAERVVGINFDSTESKLAEKRIRELNTVLESRAAALEAANKELEAFSYSVSHDLRAPLRAVDGFSRMVLADYASKLDDEGRRMLGVIRSEAQRMGRLIDDLLAFSRLGRQTIESAPVDMQALAQEVFDELLALEPERQVRFELHPLPPALGTKSMIRQVWANLIGNALKFTKQREVAEIEIGVQEAENGGQIYYIKDNGVGFDMRYMDKLFGVFQRLHNQQEFPGTGVGLALVQRIIQRHGGRVWAEAEVNRGATFYFTLPNQKP